MTAVLDDEHRSRSLREAARHLNVGKRTLERAVASGVVTAVRIGRRVTIPAAELERVVREGFRLPARPPGK